IAWTSGRKFPRIVSRSETAGSTKRISDGRVMISPVPVPVQLVSERRLSRRDASDAWCRATIILFVRLPHWEVSHWRDCVRLGNSTHENRLRLKYRSHRTRSRPEPSQSVKLKFSA